ncbi:MAG TPA: autotransporter-associated beta strand repeat-containing protein, partial [Pirellulales bacterium]|nr:autotransporter-associated beta strand repeat-containing protein [Pirellulales bacterium]
GSGDVTFSGGTLRLGNAYAESSNRAFNLNSSGGTIDVTGASATIGGSIRDGATAGGLTVQGAGGTLYLTGNNTFSGPLSVASGSSLTLTGSGAISGTAAVTVGGTLNLDVAAALNSAATVTAGGTVNIAANQSAGSLFNSGTLNLLGGASLSLSNGLTLRGGSTVGFGQVGSGNGYVVLTGGTLALNAGTETISVSGSVASAGSFALFTYGSGTYTGLLSQLQLNTGNLSLGNNLAATLSDNTAAREIDLIVYSTFVPTGNLAWTGAINSAWDTSTNNWSDGGTPAAFANGNIVTFTDSASNAVAGTATISIAAGGVQPSAITVTNSAVNYVFDSSTGSISGATALVKDGSGTLTLSGANAYSGGTLFNAGTVVIASATSLGAGTLTFNGGVLADYAGSFTISNALYTATTSGGFYIDGGLTVTATGTIGGTVALTKLGSGTLILLGQNVSNAPIIVNGGTISGNATSFGNNPIELSSGGTIVFDQSGAAGTFSNAITGTGNVVVDGTLALTNPNSSYSGFTVLNSADVTIANGGELGTLGLALNNSTLNTGAGSYAATTTLNGTNAWNVSADTLFTAGAVDGSGGLVKTGSGTLVLDSAGNFAGGVSISAGLLAVAADQALGTGAVTVSSGASLAFVNTGNYTGVNEITILGAGTPTIGAALGFSGNNSFGGNITVGGGAGALANIGFDAGSNTTLAGVLAKDGRTLELDAGGANVHVNITGTLSGSSAASDVIFNGNNLSTADFTISTPQNYNGPTYITNGSTLFLGASNVLPSTTHTDLTLTTSNPSFASKFDLAGFSDTVRILDGDAGSIVTNSNTNTASTLTVAPTSAGVSTFAGALTGNLNTVFAGVASSGEVLTSVSSYSGTTNIDSGALLVNGSLTSGGTVTVNYDTASNQAILAGIGSLVGNVLVAADGTVAHNGVLSPGNVVPDVGNLNNSHVAGLLAVAGNLTVSGTYLWDLTSVGTTTGATGIAGSDYDQVALGGHALNLPAVGGQVPIFELNLATGAIPTATDFWRATETWNVVTGLTGDPGGSFALNYVQSNTWSSLGAFSLAYSGGNEQLVWTPASVPEPSTMLLGGLATLGMGIRAWRKRRATRSRIDRTLS